MGFGIAPISVETDRFHELGAIKEKNAMSYSGLRVIREALNGQRGWKPAWRNPEPKPNYDIIVIGGGGHGLATAHIL